MRRLTLALPLSAALFAAACSTGGNDAAAPLSGDWSLDNSASHLSFVTTKAGQVVEAHRFDTLEGTVGADGKASFGIDLASVKTNVDIRDQRMRDILFETGRFAKATVSTQIDPATVDKLAIGEQAEVPVQATINLHGVDAPVETSVIVTRIAADKVEVETKEPIIVDATSFGLEGGLAKLQDLAGLPGITAQVPVTFSLVFDKKAG